MKLTDRSLKGCGGCLLLWSIPLVWSVLFGKFIDFQNGEALLTSLFESLLFISFFVLPGLLLRKKADANHKAFLESVANVIRTHRDISSQDLAQKIGLSVTKTEMIIGELSAADNGFSLRYDPSSQTYKMIPEGERPEKEDGQMGCHLPNWLVVLDPNDISSSRRRRVSCLLRINDRELAKCILLAKPFPVAGAATKTEAEEILATLKISGVNCSVKSKEAFFPIQLASNAMAWAASVMGRPYQTRAERWQSQWLRIQSEEMLSERMLTVRKAVDLARFSILHADISDVVIADMLEPLDEMDDAIDRQIAAKQPFNDSELTQMIESAEAMANAVTGAQRHVVASEEAKQKAKELQKHISQFKERH